LKNIFHADQGREKEVCCVAGGHSEGRQACVWCLSEEVPDTEKPIEQWYVEDICDMMYTCLILHNWMVTDHVHWNEEEYEDLYEAVDPEAGCNQPDEDQESDTKLDAMRANNAHFEVLEHRLNTAINKEMPAMIAAHTRLEAQKKMYKLVLSKKAHYCFARLYDKNEHKCLQEAIIAVVSTSK
jgi:hypothetical protein